MTYKLLIDLFNYEKCPWKDDWNIFQLVGPYDHDNNTKGKQWFGKKYKNKEILAMIKFLYSELKRYMEDTNIRNKNMKQRVSFYIALLNVQKLYQGEEVRIYEIFTWINVIEANIKHTVAETTLQIEEDEQIFKQVISNLKNSPSPPISDLTPYVDSLENLRVREFTDKFNEQVNHNMSALLKLDFTLIRHHLSVLRENIKIFMESKVPYIFTMSVVSRLRSVYNTIQSMKGEILDLMDMCRSHRDFCKDLLERYHVDSMDPNRADLHEYIERHEKTFSQIFKNNNIPKLPVMVPQFTDLKDTEMEIRTEENYKSLKCIYENLLEEMNLIRKVMPTKWPQILPNLSTHDAKPMLTITNGQDFRILMGSYAVYLNKLGKLIDTWSLTLRKMFEFLEVMSNFSPDVEYFEGMCTNPRDNILVPVYNINTEELKKEGSPSKKISKTEKRSSVDNSNNPSFIKSPDVQIAQNNRRRGTSELYEIPPYKEIPKNNFEKKVWSKQKSSDNFLSLKRTLTNGGTHEHNNTTEHQITSHQEIYQKSIENNENMDPKEQKDHKNRQVDIKENVKEINNQQTQSSWIPVTLTHPRPVRPDEVEDPLAVTSTSDSCGDESIPYSNTPEKHYWEWTIDDVANWIEQKNLNPQYREIFIRNKINGKKLDRLTEHILHVIGVQAWGDRIDILDDVEKLQKEFQTKKFM